MSNEVRVTLVRGIRLPKIDECDADNRVRYPIGAFGTGEYAVDGCVVGIHKTCYLIHKVEDADTSQDHLIVEAANAASPGSNYTEADIALYIVRSLS